MRGGSATWMWVDEMSQVGSRMSRVNVDTDEMIRATADVNSWDVRADGYRLVIEDGAMVGLAYGEDPWPWGDQRWLTSHLIGDTEVRQYTGLPHRCSAEFCVCPRHGTPLIYWPAGDDHACQDASCPYGAGIRSYARQIHRMG